MYVLHKSCPFRKKKLLADAMNRHIRWFHWLDTVTTVTNCHFGIIFLSSRQQLDTWYSRIISFGRNFHTSRIQGSTHSLPRWRSGTSTLPCLFSDLPTDNHMFVEYTTIYVNILPSSSCIKESKDRESIFKCESSRQQTKVLSRQFYTELTS